MRQSVRLALFAYAFPHRKTADFLFELACAGLRGDDVCVIAAPWRKLPDRSDGVELPHSIRNAPPHAPKTISALCGFPYHEIAHDDLDGLKALQARYGFRRAIISGARILKGPVIDLFEDGIVNFHPGLLPDAGGLDAFLKAVLRKCPPAVTAHLIDRRIDAGTRLFVEPCAVGADDSMEVVRHNLYQSELRALRRFLASTLAGEGFAETPIPAPERSQPLTPTEKYAAIGAFPAWRAANHLRQQSDRLFDLCKDGHVDAVRTILAEFPGLLEARTSRGWTPLIVAAFHQHADLVRLLLAMGADVNACNRNGTTVLMYAKTAVLNDPGATYDLLELLLSAGADKTRRDCHGKTILDYVSAAGDTRLAHWLAG